MRTSPSPLVRRRRSPVASTLRALMFVLASLGVVAPTATGQNLVLWNKLGSVAEVQTSEVGHDGAIVGANYGFEPARHGDGYIRYAIHEYL